MRKDALTQGRGADFAWTPGLFGDCLGTVAHRGCQAVRIRYENRSLFGQPVSTAGGEPGWQYLAHVDFRGTPVRAFTDLERDLLGSVLRSLGYLPGRTPARKADPARRLAAPGGREGSGSDETARAGFPAPRGPLAARNGH